MVKKTTAQLRREIASLKKKKTLEMEKKHKLMKELKEKKELERELKELKRSGVFKALKKISKNKPTKSQLKAHGKQGAKAAKTAWRVAGKIVNKLSKIQV